MNANIIKLTDAAVAHINKTIAQRGGGIGFRISVKETGCSGFMYKPEIVDEIKSDDLQITTSQGLRVFIDPDCVDIIKGTTLDFVKKELGQHQLLFNNPNVASECGCGESFNLKEDADDE